MLVKLVDFIDCFDWLENEDVKVTIYEDPWISKDKAIAEHFKTEETYKGNFHDIPISLGNSYVYPSECYIYNDDNGDVCFDVTIKWRTD